MTATKIKDSLLNTGYFEDNIYLNAYVDLIFKNTSDLFLQQQKSIKHKFHKHHLIPVMFYEPSELGSTKRRASEVKANADPENFKIIVSIADHVKLHCYLALCSKALEFQIRNANAVKILSADLLFPENLKYLLFDQQFFDLYSKVFLMIASPNLKQFQFSSENNHQKGKHYIHRGAEVIVVEPCKLQYYLEDGWKLGRKDGVMRCHVHKNSEYRLIPMEQLSYYLSLGWEYGAAGKSRVPKRKNNILPENTEEKRQLLSIRQKAYLTYKDCLAKTGKNSDQTLAAKKLWHEAVAEYNTFCKAHPRYK